ncbi:hypothetical protein F4604DRAFT_1674163 [Suillus subluteus]|nr:hypothetical protein F4604DRAFT_1674163 [Suillus subluteus]
MVWLSSICCQFTLQQQQQKQQQQQQQQQCGSLASSSSSSNSNSMALWCLAAATAITATTATTATTAECILCMLEPPRARSHKLLPITAGMHRQRVDSGASQGYPVTLTPCSTKRLKVYTNQVAEEVGVQTPVFTSSLMIVALVLKNDSKEKLKLLANLKELLTSKDFKTHLEILKFIKGNQEVFKVPASLFKDMELIAVFAKIISECLSTICGNMKAKNRLTFLLSIDINEIECNMLNGDAEEDNNVTNALQDMIVDENAALGIVNSSNAHDSESINADGDYDKDDTNFKPNAGNPGDIEGDGLVVVEKGKPESKSDLYTAGRFWNFVDSSLTGAHNAAKEQVNEDRGPAFKKAYISTAGSV